jgi:hypothetical protein
MWIAARQVERGTLFHFAGVRKFMRFQIEEPGRNRLMVVADLKSDEPSLTNSILVPSYEFRPGPLHLAACWSGAAGYRFYVNGKKFGSPRTFSTVWNEEPTSTVGLKARNGAGTTLPQTITVGQLRISSIERYSGSFAPPRVFDADNRTLALYRFDEGEGDIVHDLSGRDRHAHRNGGEWLPRADDAELFLDRSPSLEFAGAGQHVALPQLPLMDAKGVTVEAVIQLDAPQPDQGVIIRTSQMSLKVAGTESFFSMGSKPGDPKPLTTTHSTGIPLGRPVHLAGVWNGPRIEIYVDGQLQGWNEDGDQVVIRGGSNTLGDHNAIAKEPFLGRIYRLRVSKKARYIEPFKPNLKLPSDDDTIVRYGLEEGEGNTLRDSSGHGLDGQIVGAKWRRGTESRGGPAGPRSESQFELLSLLDLQKDRVAASNLVGTNNWSVEGSTLKYASDGQSGKVTFPVSLNDVRAFELEMRVQRLSGNGVFTIELPVSGSLQSGLDLVPAGRIELGLQGGRRQGIGQWPTGLGAEGLVKALVRFHTDGSGSVAVTVDGQDAAEWEGPLSQLGKPLEFHPDFPGERVLSLLCSRDSFSFAFPTLRILEGSARKLR